MRRKIILLFLFILCFSGLIISQGIREAVWAGKFYDAKPEALSQRLDYLFKNAKETPSFSGKILALIAPHAGYIYSGRVAASAYRLVQGKDFESVVIIAPSHRHAFRGCSIYLQGGYKTPLGLAPIDEDLAAKLSKASGFKYIAKAHQEEHSVEVQIPFIQKALPQAKIVPIVMGYPSKKTIETLAQALSDVIQEEKVLLIASTDLSHYLPKKQANDIDAQTISLIQSFKTDILIRMMERRENIMCGGGPVASILIQVKKKEGAKVKILHYADSSESGGDESGVVGYLAAAICQEASPAQLTISSEEKKELLHIARLALEEFILEKRVLNHQTQNVKLMEKRGAFVTLKKRGLLRGCIGFIKPVLPLYQTVIQAAIYAACRDQRFLPVSPDELKDLEIEISVLTPLKKIDNPNFIEVGKHGLFISKGNRSGLLLPQVPVENQWSREIFLQQTCLKAGLPQDAWKQEADLFVFEAIVFH